MTMTYAEWDQRTDTIVAGLKQRILASTDWAHLQLSTGTQNTTLSSGASAGATSISTAATIPSGSYIVIGNGAANPEVRLTTAVSGAGPFTVSWNAAEPLANSYSSSAAVGVGSFVKATTTRGAQMVVDLAGTTPDTLKVQPIVYVTHDGTTAGNSIQRYVIFKRFTGSAATILHCRVSAGKEWLYLDVEGPRGGETNADATAGSYRSPLYLGDVVPYDAGDTTPAVVLVGGSTTGVPETTVTVRVSRNRDGTGTWVPARLHTLVPATVNVQVTNAAWQPLARNGDYVQAPFVVFEMTDGLRGRLANAFFGGFAGFIADASDLTPPPQGTEMTYGSWKYKALYPQRTDGSGGALSYGFGSIYNNGQATYSVIVWVPDATNP